MKKGRLKRNILVIFWGIATFLVSLYFKISPKNLNNFTEIMSASLSFSAIVTAIFFASFSLIPSSGSNKLVSMMEDLGTDIKIMDRLLIATVLSFVSSLLSFIALFFDKEDTSSISIYLISGWLATTVMMFVSSFLVLRVLIKLVETYNNFKNIT
ncbi:hypothetical protein [Streptococcus cuniculi]|uniref:Uncharacterized protein n=1 Tax=Streptococcus cuniculi TaxID=1432788 RepID=A0A4Y9JD79_9STRE|nr:hypothetical protein [Streptococcus cuniculi]MBF0778167.1 hypothetical protein [Streptococcus cuniculi]TFU97909.1 hypothetical protein E4T82_05440 [Streptococcus cuniculi]